MPRGPSYSGKALSLWQPWASLIAVGGKHIETRHWRPPHWLVGQRIAIHAAKTSVHLRMCEEEPFNRYLTRERCPLGALVAVVTLSRVREITAERALQLEETNWHEFAFGNYKPGRFAWALTDLCALPEPVEWRGRQGIFDVPASVVGETAAAGDARCRRHGAGGGPR
jgi:hypothetical protein